MQNGIRNKISLIKTYECGYCINNIGRIYKNMPHEKRKFPAKCFLLEHQNYGYIMIDSGYSKMIFENGITSKIYNMLNKTICNDEDILINQLKKDGIYENDIKYIIITHMHPDHIGGLMNFNQSKVIISEECNDLIYKSSYKDLVFKNLIPGTLEGRLQSIRLESNSILKGFKGKDLFGDDSLWIIALEGHAKGQIGVFLKFQKLFFVADATWGRDLMDKKMKFIPRFIQHNFDKYKQTIDKLKSIRDSESEIKLLATHDTTDNQR